MSAARRTSRAVRRGVTFTAALALAALVGAAPADETDGSGLVLRIGTLHVGDGRTLTDALVVVEGGRFAVVGEGEAPPRAKVRRFPAAHASPGFVDAATRVGLGGGAAEDVEVLTPSVRVGDAFDATSPDLDGLAAEGTTLLGLSPAPVNVAAGRAATARVNSQRAIAGPAALVSSSGPPVFSFVFPALRTDRVPATFAGARRLLEEAFAGRPWRTAGDPDVPVASSSIAALRDLAPQSVLAYADSPASARAAVETLRAKKLAPVLVGVRECAAQPDALADLGAPCIVTGLRPSDPLALLALPARLAERSVPVAISTGAPDRSPKSLRLAISLAVAAGLPGEAALTSVTSAPATMLGVGDRAGLVRSGFDADLVVFDGAPWELRSRVLLVVSGGRVAFERAAPEGAAK